MSKSGVLRKPMPLATKDKTQIESPGDSEKILFMVIHKPDNQEKKKGGQTVPRNRGGKDKNKKTKGHFGRERERRKQVRKERRRVMERGKQVEDNRYLDSVRREREGNG